uniref:immunoglobulin superfamily DCC subclass member 4-like isoform X2 n=1 Tax=Myxine glutinosa TaxID=7769 RepID=UPI00358E3922
MATKVRALVVPLLMLAVSAGRHQVSCAVRLSCQAGPTELLVNSSEQVILNCMPGAGMVHPINTTWMRDGVPLLVEPHAHNLENGSLVLTVGEDSSSVEGLYSCRVAGPQGVILSRSLFIRHTAVPSFLLHPEPQTVTVRAAARLRCSATGHPVPSIFWERDGNPIPTSELRFSALPNGVLQISNVQPADAASYRCRATTNPMLSIVSRHANLTVDTKPMADLPGLAFVVRPENITVVAGGLAVLECLAFIPLDASPSGPIVSWSHQDGRPLRAEVSIIGRANLLFTSAWPKHAGAYVCQVEDTRSQESLTSTAWLTVLTPPHITKPPENLSKARAGTARFICIADGEPVPTIRWLKDGHPVHSNGRIKIQDNDHLVINQLSLDDVGMYQCVAENSVGEDCAVAHLVVTIRQGLPGPPRNLRVVTRSSSTILLSWDRPKQHSGEIIGFSVHYQKAVGNNNQEYQFAIINKTMEFLVTELEANTNYIFYAVAYSKGGASQTSEKLNARTEEGVPLQPPSPSLSWNGESMMNVSWNPLSHEKSQSTLLSYRVDYGLQHEDQFQSVEVPAQKYSVMLQGLQHDKQYRVRLAAATYVGYGNPSLWAFYAIPAPGNDSKIGNSSSHDCNCTSFPFPSELIVRKFNNTTLLVSWKSPRCHIRVHSYHLFCYLVDQDQMVETGPVKPIVLKHKVTSYLLLDLDPGSLYKVLLVTVTRHKRFERMWIGRTLGVLNMVSTPPSNAVSSKAPSYQPENGQKDLQIDYFASPTHLSAISNGSRAIWLAWRKPAISSMEPVNYMVRFRIDRELGSNFSYIASSEEQVLVQGLRPFTHYHFAVRLHCYHTEGLFSSVVEATTMPDRPDSSPQNVTVQVLNSKSVGVMWNPPAKPNGPIVQYILLSHQNHSVPNEHWTRFVISGELTHTEVRGLERGVQYFFKMAALTEAGPGPLSEAVSVDIPNIGLLQALDPHTLTGVLLGICTVFICLMLCVLACLYCGKHRQRGGRQPQLCCCMRAAEDLGPGGNAEGSSIHISRLDKNPEQPEAHELDGLVCCNDDEGQQTSADPSSLTSEYTCLMGDAKSCPAQKIGNGGFHDMRLGKFEGDDCANAAVNSAEASACEIWQTANSTMLTDVSFTSLQSLENDTELQSLQASAADSSSAVVEVCTNEQKVKLECANE